MLESFHSITLLAILNLGIACYFWRNQFKYFFALAISFINVTSEVIAFIIVSNGDKSLLATLYSWYYIFHFSLWIIIAFSFLKTQSKGVRMGVVFWLLSLLSLYLLGDLRTNSSVIIIGSLVYLLFFMKIVFGSLKKENIGFLTSNSFTLLCAPILFMIASVFLYSFSGQVFRIRDYRFYGFDMYDWLMNIANYTYYLLLANFFISGRKKL